MNPKVIAGEHRRRRRSFRSICCLIRLQWHTPDHTVLILGATRGVMVSTSALQASARWECRRRRRRRREEEEEEEEEEEINVFCKCFNTSQREMCFWFICFLLVCLFLTKSHEKRPLLQMLSERDEMSIRGLITLCSLNIRPNSIQTDWKLCEINGAEAFDFSHSCDLEWKSKSVSLVSHRRV